MLETAPSFSIYSQAASDEIEAEKEREIEVLVEKGVNLTIDSGSKLDAKVTVTEGSGDFSFVKSKSMDLIKEEEDEVVKSEQEVGSPMYLATGLGEFLNHPVELRKHAELLQEKGDLLGAEEFYFRATQADPGNGEIMVQYAQLVWELHHDHERALTYFERAAQACPDNSIVMAAYAKFLWETEDDDENNSAHSDSAQEDNDQQESGQWHTTARIDAHHVELVDRDNGPTFDMGDSNKSIDIRSYYERMINENPSHPIFLKKYAQFLYQSERDLQGAEEYYSRAIQADPRDGETLSEYATLLWELYHDQDRTLNYLEKAIEAAPQNSDVLAAYARVLWTVDDE